MNKEQLSRKLAVILHADVVGSTSLVQSDETLAHQRMRDTFTRFAETIDSGGGITHEIRGDALLAEFSLASNAIEAALSFQESNASFLASLDDEIRPEIRAGIAMGEVIIADNTITGEAVVLAQRLEQLAFPGGICIHATARDTVPRRLPFTYTALDNISVKGFSRPISAYRVERAAANGVVESGNPDKEEFADPVLFSRPSIAVLPFENMSGEPEQEYFSDGIAEDITTALSRVSSLLVVACNSTLAYKGKEIDVKQIGREQGVRYVLKGSVRKAGNRVRVTTNLIDTGTGTNLYAERFDRDLDDIFAVQDEITSKISVELQVKLTSGEQARLWAGGTRNVAAWEGASKADELMANHVREDNHEARVIIQQVLSLDPEYAAAWSTLGMTHWQDARWGWSEEKERSLEIAEKAARRAEEIDRNYPGTYTLLGMIFLMRGQHDKSLEMMNKAARLAPNHAASIALLAFSCHLSGKPDECIRNIRRAMRLSPIYPSWYLVPVAGSNLMKGKPQAAHDALIKALERDPKSNLARTWLAIALVELSRTDEAREQADIILDLDPGFSVSSWSSGLNFIDPSWNRKLEQNLRAAGLPD